MASKVYISKKAILDDFKLRVIILLGFLMVFGLLLWTTTTTTTTTTTAAATALIDLGTHKKDMPGTTFIIS